MADLGFGGYDLGGFEDLQESFPWTGGGDGIYVLPGEGGSGQADTGLTVPTDTTNVDPITGRPVDTAPGTPGPGWGNPGIWGRILADLDTGGITKALGNIFSGNNGQLSQLAAFAGLAGLLNKTMGNRPQTPVGYQGGIPKYVFERSQTPIEQQRPVRYETVAPTETGAAPTTRTIAYRPGQGGITYFSPLRYRLAGNEAKPSAEENKLKPPVTPSVRREDEKFPETYEFASGGQMPGGIAMLARGRYLKGNGDGVSDSIPARFAGSGQEARLADGEFVIPARVVAELGNGSSDAGARKLYAMLDRVEAQARKAKRGKPSGADRELKRLA